MLRTPGQCRQSKLTSHVVEHNDTACTPHSQAEGLPDTWLPQEWPETGQRPHGTGLIAWFHELPTKNFPAKGVRTLTGVQDPPNARVVGLLAGLQPRIVEAFGLNEAKKYRMAVALGGRPRA